MLRDFFKDETTTPLDSLIDGVFEEMHANGVNSDEYPTMLSYLERLYGLKTKERPDPVSRDTLALIAGNLMGILLIVAYEQKHVMTSKGFQHIIRPK